MTSFIGKWLTRKVTPSLNMLKKVDGRPMLASMNPGMHVLMDFISDTEEIDLINEVSILSDDYGFECGSQDVSVDGKDQKFKISALRVTGRPEANARRSPPWGYGDYFNIGAVPPRLRELVRKISETSHFAEALPLDTVNPVNLRDITINYRTDAMFKLDPHIDPTSDGSVVLHVGLGSDVVFTLTPDMHQLKEYARRENVKYDMHLPLSVRTLQSAVDVRSWTSEDIDALMKRKSLLYIAGDARYEWKHGIRSGVDVGPPFDGICDWWGDIETGLVKRERERVSIVLSYK